MLVNIMIGLPGSGKSKLTEELLDDNTGLLDENSRRASFDDTVEAAIKDLHDNYYESLIVDVLHPTNDHLEQFMGKLESALSKHGITPKYKFWVFNPNKIKSHINDYTRDRGTSQYAIKRTYQDWDFEVSELPGEVIIVPTYTPTFEETLVYELQAKTDNVNSKYIKSDTWMTDILHSDSSVRHEEPIHKYDNPHLKGFLGFLGILNTDVLRNELIDELATLEQIDNSNIFYQNFKTNFYLIEMSELIELLEEWGLL